MLKCRIKYKGSDCTGCKLCSLLCAYNFYEKFNPRYGRIQVLKDEFEDVPHLCIQCDKPRCIDVCPRGAIVSEKGIAKVIEKKCVGCGSCVEACPYKGIWLNPKKNKAFKCEFCDEIVCAKFCPSNALVIEK
ncbi:MAG: 4Fe-4S dicluster domain-containing protein [Candidatus Thermoplasmatota archaeon]